ncbi:MAG TPA: Lrp/AsnC family transcriptional regulator [Mucilaginibacter sp.]|nr:Lrp/AsnC family transcriptional regulator [Mucilaginibacter sp.]
MHQLDPTDIRILNILQQDGRITERQLAARVFKAAPTVHDRIEKLAANGYIKGYITLLDREKIGRAVLVVLMVKLKAQNTDLLTEFENHVREMSEVQSCFIVSGDWNFILQVTAATPQHYAIWLLEKINSQSNVGEVQSNFLLKETKSHGAFEL